MERDTVITGWGEHAAVRTREWCHIGRWSEGAPFTELYDVHRDPEELSNVADQHGDLVKRVRAELKQHVDSGWAVTPGTFAIILRGEVADCSPAEVMRYAPRHSSGGAGILPDLAKIPDHPATAVKHPRHD